MQQETYTYRNMPIPGGGYVTGFVFHPSKENVLYCRTDIGGTYRYDFSERRWHSLIDHVTMDFLDETFPIALALDEKHPEYLYIACGVNAKQRGTFAFSKDYGENFIYHEMPMHVHGNLNGRGTGYRLIVDKKDERVLWFASQENGLWKSEDQGATWVKCQAFLEDYMTFVGQSSDGAILFAAGAGITVKRADNLRGHSLYVSYNRGESFEPLESEITGVADEPIEGVKLAGLVAQRYALDDKYLYVSYSVMGKNAYVNELGYSCDGGSVIGGKVVRYKLRDGRLLKGEDITGNLPDLPAEYADTGILNFGFSGIDTAKQLPGMVVMSTICNGDGDCIYRSFDYGTTWECILHDLDTGVMDFRSSYMRPEYNGGHSLIHWLTDIKINPSDANNLWFNTGTGVFCTNNLTEGTVHFTDLCDGIEETVHLNLYSPPKGDACCIDILGDLGGFAFTKRGEACSNSFADEHGNRYITCINADYSDEDPDCVIVTPRGNWTGLTKGGLILSKDQCKTFKRLDMPYGLSDAMDETLRRIETPNVNSGWVAMSADKKNIVWSVANGIKLPVSQVLVSNDGGEHFSFVKVYDIFGEEKKNGGFKVFSDRIDSDYFYGFGDHSDLYVSTDGGKTFYEKKIAARDMSDNRCDFPPIEFSLIDCANKTEVRGDSGHFGSFYLAAGKHGLWKLEYKKAASEFSLKKLSKDGDVFYRLGLGIGKPDGNYFTDPKALYVAASLDGEYGFYRTTDEGKSFVRLNTEKQMYGEINSMEGDSRTFGVFYIATGSRGVLYGESNCYTG